MKKDIFNVKLKKVSAMSGWHRYKQSNRGQLGIQEKGIRIIHLIGLDIPFGNKTGLQLSNRSIRINLHGKHPLVTNEFIPRS